MPLGPFMAPATCFCYIWLIDIDQALKAIEILTVYIIQGVVSVFTWDKYRIYSRIEPCYLTVAITKCDTTFIIDKHNALIRYCSNRDHVLLINVVYILKPLYILPYMDTQLTQQNILVLYL